MPVSGVTTEEELTLIREFIVLPFLLDLVDKYSQYPYDTPLEHFKPEHFQRLMDIIHTDLVEVRKGIRVAQIKVLEVSLNGPMLYYEYYCRGYRFEFRLIKTVVKAELSVKLGKYVRIIEKEILRK